MQSGDAYLGQTVTYHGFDREKSGQTATVVGIVDHRPDLTVIQFKDGVQLRVATVWIEPVLDLKLYQRLIHKSRKHMRFV